MSADESQPGPLPRAQEGTRPVATSTDAPASTHPGAPRNTRLVTSQQLFAGTSEVQIDHRGVFYRLRQTSLGKLILTK